MKFFRKQLCRLCRFFLCKFPVSGRYRLKNFILNNNLHRDIDVVINIDSSIKMRLRLDEYVQQNIFFYNYYEKNETEYWKKNIQAGYTIFDIGSNVGYYSLLASPIIGNTGRVFMFEPVGINMERAKANILLSGFSNIHCNKKAITNKKGSVNIRVADDSNLGMSGLSDCINESGVDEQVEGITLDEFVRENKIESVEMIKIDVEGAEPLVIQGAKTCLQKFSPILMIEVCIETLVRLNFTINDVYNPLYEMGYRPYLINDDLTLMLVEKPISKEGLIVFKKN